MVSGVTSDDQLVLVIRYQNGNTYGHRRIPVLSLPEVRINNYYIKHTQQGNTHEYLAGIGWNPVAESLEIDNETSWRPVAFRVWWDHSGNTGGMTGILDTIIPMMNPVKREPSLKWQVASLSGMRLRLSDR